MLIEVNKSENSYSVTPNVTTSVNGISTKLALFLTAGENIIAFKEDGSNITEPSELDQVKILVVKGFNSSEVYIDNSVYTVTDWLYLWTTNSGVKLDSYTVTYTNGVLTLTGTNSHIYTFTLSQQSQSQPETVCLAALITGCAPVN